MRGGFNRECGFLNYKHSQSVRRWNIWKYYRSAPPSILNCNGLPFMLYVFVVLLLNIHADDIHNNQTDKATRLQFMHRIKKLILSEKIREKREKYVQNNWMVSDIRFSHMFDKAWMNAKQKHHMWMIWLKGKTSSMQQYRHRIQQFTQLI